MPDRESLRRLLKHSPSEAAAVIGFNWDPASYLHPALRQQWFPEIPSAVWEEPRLQARLSGLLLTKTDLRDTCFVEIPNELWPLVLLPVDRLQRLALHIGALILGIRVRASLSREHVLAWKKKLGDDAYRFAMNSASLLPAGKFPLTAIANEDADELGASVIMAALAGASEALLRRVALKFPDNISALDLDSVKATQISLMIARIVEGEWFSSLAALRK